MSTPNVWVHRKQISTADILSPKSANVGRSPWYDTSKTNKSRRCKQTFLIGVAGGTASGKTSVCQAIVNNLQLPWVQILSLDCFYRPLTSQERLNVSDYNFDHPAAFDWDLLLNVLKELKQGKAVRCPQYDFTTHSRKDEYEIMYGADVVLCEGILMLHNVDIVKQFDVKVFVKTDDDIRLIRRIKRDMAERGRTLESILAQYQKTVKPSYQLFCEPTQTVADIVIPRGRDNIVAIQLLCDHIKSILIEGGNINPIFYEQNSFKCNDGSIVVPNNVMLPSSDNDNNNNLQQAIDQLSHNDKLNGHQLLQTISLISNQLLTICIKQFIPQRFVTPSPASTPPLDLEENENQINDQEIIYFDEDSEQIMDGKQDDDGLTIQDIANLKIETDGDSIKIDGKEEEEEEKENKVNLHDFGICVVTIFSGGMLFGETIMDQMGNNESFKLNYGSIHIFHESHKPSKPRFYDRKLPININKQKVIMFDAFIGTGNRARMAIQVIIDHHVPESNICFISLLSSQEGLINLAKVFPNVQFITGRMTKHNNEHWESVPVTSSLVLKYCKASGIDIVEHESESCLFNQ